MSKKTIVKVAGFAVAAAATVGLVGFAANSTGAYFTDSHSGAIKASTGHVKVAISPADGQLSFTNLLPGEFQDRSINYQAQGTGAEDIWLVLPTNGDAEALIGNPHDAHGGGLGRYGHFAVTSTNGASFTSFNLSNPDPGDTSTPCTIDANGEGGSTQQATSTNNADPGSYVPYCAPHTAILLASGLTNGQSGTATITFGFTKVLKNGQDAPLNQVAAFKIVATQAGINPSDVNNAAF